MRERALEIDSHQECMGSSAETELEVESGLGLGLGAVAMVVEEAEDVGELVLWFRWKSIMLTLGLVI